MIKKLALALCALVSLLSQEAVAQCTGNMQPGFICGNPTGSPAPARGTAPSASGLGLVTGPASAGNGNIVIFDGITGKLIKDSGIPVGGGGGGITALTGDVTASGTGSVVTTLATVNANVGSFGTATQTSQFTVNAKGLITGASNVTIELPLSAITSGFGTGVATFLATPSCANFGTAVTGATGTGACVFATSPTLTTPVLGVASTTSMTITGAAGAGFTSYPAQSSVPSAPATGFREFADANGRYSWIRAADGFVRTWDATLSADRVYTLFDASGTIVLDTATQTLTNKSIDATQLTGTVASGRISGSYTGITGTGTLTAGATGAGFTLAFGSSTLTGAIPIANGGTAATTEAGARTNLGVVALGGDTMTGLLVLSADPATNLGAATKQYVDAIASGIQVKPSSAAATTANITLSGEQTIDTVVTSASIVLVKNQTAPAENGIYTTGAGAWTRITQLDVWAEVVGAQTFITGGSANINKQFTAIVAAGGTINVTAMPWAQTGSNSGYVAGSGLSLTGSTFSIAAGAVTNAMLAGSIASSKLVGTDIATVGTLTSGSTGAGFTVALSTSTISGTLAAARLPAFGSGDVSFASAGGAGTIANSAVTYAKMQNVSASNRFLGRVTAGAGVVEEVTVAQAKTMLAVSFSDVLGTIANGQVSGSYTNITGVGTVTAGVWNGTAVAVGFGGTGQTTYTKGDILAAASASVLNKLAVGTNNQALIANSAATNGVNWAAIPNSVSNSDGTLTISPTTGAVVASLNLAHTNIWAGHQYFKTGHPWADIRAYGAVQSNNDDTAAIQAAIDAVAAIGGGIVYIPPGSSCVSSTITITGNGAIHLQGASMLSSAIITCPGSNIKMISVAGSQHQINDLSLQGFDSVAASSTSHVVHLLSGSVGCKLNNLSISRGYNGVENEGIDNLIYASSITMVYGTSLFHQTGGALWMRRTQMDQIWPVSLPTYPKTFSARGASTAYSIGDVASFSGYYVQASVGGTTGSGSPPALTNYTDNISDGTVTWKLVGRTTYYGLHIDGTAIAAEIHVEQSDFTGSFRASIGINNTNGAAAPAYIIITDSVISQAHVASIEATAGSSLVVKGNQIGGCIISGCSSIALQTSWGGDTTIADNLFGQGGTGASGILLSAGRNTVITGNQIFPYTTAISVSANISFFTIASNAVGSSSKLGANTNSIVVTAGTGDYFSIVNNITGGAGNVSNGTGCTTNCTITGNH